MCVQLDLQIRGYYKICENCEVTWHLTPCHMPSSFGSLETIVIHFSRNAWEISGKIQNINENLIWKVAMFS